MALSTAVKYFDIAMQGAPGLNGNAGGLLPILRACLVSGFNQLTLDSLTVSNGIATATRAAGLPYRTLQVVTIAGATPSGLNGEKRLLSVGLGVVTFDAEGIADGAASGTITIKVAPAGWSEPFTSAGNIAVFLGASGERNFFRVNDSSSDAGAVSVTAYTGMTDINTGDAAFSNGTSFYFMRPQSSNTMWQLIADERTVYWVCACQSYTSAYYGMNAFGELFSFVPNDTGKTFLAAGKNTAGGGQSGYHQRGSLFSNQANNSTWKRLGASLASVSNIRAMRQLQDDSGYLGPTFPSPVDQGLMLTDNLLVDYTVAGAPIIGKTPGAFWVLANQPFQFTNPAPQISGVGGLEGRTLAMVPFYVPNAANHQRVAFDIIGPWEYN